MGLLAIGRPKDHRLWPVFSHVGQSVVLQRFVTTSDKYCAQKSICHEFNILSQSICCFLLTSFNWTGLNSNGRSCLKTTTFVCNLFGSGLVSNSACKQDRIQFKAFCVVFSRDWSWSENPFDVPFVTLLFFRCASFKKFKYGKIKLISCAYV